MFVSETPRTNAAHESVSACPTSCLGHILSWGGTVSRQLKQFASPSSQGTCGRAGAPPMLLRPGHAASYLLPSHSGQFIQVNVNEVELHSIRRLTLRMQNLLHQDIEKTLDSATGNNTPGSINHSVPTPPSPREHSARSRDARHDKPGKAESFTRKEVTADISAEH